MTKVPRITCGTPGKSSLSSISIDSCHTANIYKIEANVSRTLFFTLRLSHHGSATSLASFPWLAASTLGPICIVVPLPFAFWCRLVNPSTPNHVSFIIQNLRLGLYLLFRHRSRSPLCSARGRRFWRGFVTCGFRNARYFLGYGLFFFWPRILQEHFWSVLTKPVVDGDGVT